jgi:hypothetical protein
MPTVAVPGKPILETVIMAKEHAKLDKVIELIETAMKTGAAEAELRETQRQKAEAELEGFKDSYARALKEHKESDKNSIDILQKADGIAENELKGHPLVTRLNKLLAILKKIPRDGQYDDLNKAVNALEDWDVKLEKTDMPKKAIKHLQQAKVVLSARQAVVVKLSDEYSKVYGAAMKDLETVKDPDVKKRLKALLGP